MRVAEAPSSYVRPDRPTSRQDGVQSSARMGQDVHDPPTADAEVEGLLTLKGLHGVGDRTVLKLVEAFGSARAALAGSRKRFERVAGTVAAASRSDPASRATASKAVRDAKVLGLTIVTLHDRRYPDRLRALHDPPSVLFTVGSLDLLRHEAVAIVGTRRATEAGRWMATRLGVELASAGVVVVSGMAMGIDAAAHRGALSASDRTIAVLGGGAERASPRINEKLYRRIRARGLVLSEFLPHELPQPHHFPKRNRIIAALTRAVVVVEAAQKSGALITVDHALDLGREIYAVPGPVRGDQSRGTNALIRDGARALLDPAQLLSELGLELNVQLLQSERVLSPPTESADYLLWTTLTDEPRHIDRLAGIAGVEASQVLVGLTRLEVSGWATRRPGMRFARAAGPDAT